jgi:hypothetical protein
VNNLLAWRGLVAQIAFLASLLYFAKLAPEQHTPIMVALAGMGALLTQRAKNQAAGDSGNSDGTSLYPGQMRTKETRIIDVNAGDKPPPSGMPRKSLLSIAVGLVWALFAVFVLLHCNQPAQTTATEIEAGVSIAQGICTEVADVTLNPIVSLVCPFLDRNGQPVKNADGTPRTIMVTMPRAQWENIKNRQPWPGGPPSAFSDAGK